MKTTNNKKQAIFIDDRYIRIDKIASIVVNHAIPDTNRYGLAIRMESGEEHVFIYNKVGKKIAESIAKLISEHFDLQGQFYFPDLTPLPVKPAPKVEEVKPETEQDTAEKK